MRMSTRKRKSFLRSWLFGTLMLIMGAVAETTAASTPDAASKAPVAAEEETGSARMIASLPVVASGGKASSTADHGKFKELQRAFKSGPEVTQACLTCHNEAAHQVMQSVHWTWETVNPLIDKKLGKRHAANNFCGSPLSNEPRCTSCHAGYGWQDKNYDFTNQNNVDCLACHDTTATYKKFPTDAGHPLYEPRERVKGSGKFEQPPDLTRIAQAVGKSGRHNCGACHFNGGGGDAVKHGDLDSSLIAPSPGVDVHMSPQGGNLSCADCHTFNAHQPSGSRYAAMARDTRGRDMKHEDHIRATCESCHDLQPHKNERLNRHGKRIACQTCHIPEFARGGIATKTLWDWSTAGKRDAEGKPLFIKDDHDRLIYSAEKGDFSYGENLRPTYKWYNGVVRQIVIDEKIGDKLDDRNILELNRVEGSARDPNARIWPFKVMVGKQPYDPVNQTLVVNHVYGNDDTAFWGNYDYAKSIQAGMDYAGLPYSGKYDFIETRMNWFITHMVTPKEQALQCQDCHTRSAEGRLSEITDIYLPGRDRNHWLDLLGGAAVLAVIAASLLHGVVRILSRRREHDA
ncbi:Cytochrome c family protein [Sterolibacterium denitrificans]|uniref:Cytochrome c family protein n=2 Tax=Sterolibacterium denitrificans TaxID=157592 RepID=A0A7Z7HQ31_9PROT|nr:Cytochrome c family protein [Sterolibacterium denitrificans]